ncbi:hypothetical protein SCP_0213270 [Sparassis crispa]|uniref:Uncharacterized protein n=1 Tax=Sparassis crispa TaxID=139825 RepID=A0A401GD63_9APHY|nr:hypothetical protein SCP_0213270 [Sparassis crispa]GBE80124.1 hypothetical protein SCP_0213270 [Sparassis crispa]
MRASYFRNEEHPPFVLRNVFVTQRAPSIHSCYLYLAYLETTLSIYLIVFYPVFFQDMIPPSIEMSLANPPYLMSDPLASCLSSSAY